jgi:hypothetical protein
MRDTTPKNLEAVDRLEGKNQFDFAQPRNRLKQDLKC